MKPLDKGHHVKLLSRYEWATLIAIIVYSFIPAFGGLLRVLELAGGPAVAPANPRALANPFPIAAHIMASFLFCIAGAMQFLPSIRRHRPAAHRLMGRGIAFAGCASATTGLWMTHTYAFPAELQGSLLYSVRIVVGLSMIGLIGWSVVAIRSRNVVRHSAAMIRAYAIGQGASTQTFLGIGWIIISGAEPLGPLRDGLMIFAWVLNLVAAECVIGGLAGRPGSWQLARRSQTLRA